MNTQRLISPRLGVMRGITKLPRLHKDPFVASFGIWPCDTTKLNGEKFEGRSSGCNHTSIEAYLGTIGETIERYCPAFYDINKMFYGKYVDIVDAAVPPSEYALFHHKQHEYYRQKKYTMGKFDEETLLHWDSCIDLTNGVNTYTPAAFIYLPWTKDDQWITIGTSTGLAAHTNYYAALQTALYEVIERDSFVITWHHKIFRHKIIIDHDIQSFINKIFPVKYEWHLFDITYDIDIPTAFGICFGEAEYGKFVAVGTACRGTLADAVRKVILEIGQTISYFRYLLGKKKDWMPSDNFDLLQNFEDHSILYIKRPELQSVFNTWRNAPETKCIDFCNATNESHKEQVINIIKQLKKNSFNVLVKDLTTPCANQVGFHCIRVVVPQLLQMGGAYPFYFLGGNRLYDVPPKLGYPRLSFDDLNKFPHPFP